MSFGVYPEISLQKAREKLRVARLLVAQGINLQKDKQEKKAKLEFDALNTFEKVSDDWFTEKVTVFSLRHQKKVRGWLKAYINPVVGDKPLNQLSGPMLLATTQILVKQNKLDTAHRVLQNMRQVFEHGYQKGFINHNPVQNLKGALPSHKVKNMAAFTEPSDVARLLKSIDNYHGSLTVTCALKLAPLLFQRIGELRHMKWSELNFNKNEWRFVSSKTETHHIVPLANQALSLIEIMRPFSKDVSEYVFPGFRTNKRPMSDGAINAALAYMGYDTKQDMISHGFRAIARTLGEQELNFEEKHIERQLAHKVAGPLGTAYERAQFFKQRKVMMQNGLIIWIS